MFKYFLCTVILVVFSGTCLYAQTFENGYGLYSVDNESAKTCSLVGGANGLSVLSPNPYVKRKICVGKDENYNDIYLEEMYKVTSVGMTCSRSGHWYKGISCSVEKIKLPNSIERIYGIREEDPNKNHNDYGASQSTKSLRHIVMNDQLSVIDDFAFQNCEKLDSVENFENTQLTSLGEGVFNMCAFRWIRLPHGLIEIGNGAISGCKNLKGVVLPSGLSIIGPAAFVYCPELITVSNLENTQVSIIGDGAFQQCYKFSVVKLPKDLVEIGCNSFNLCGIKELFVGGKLNKVGSGAFFRYKHDAIGISDIIDKVHIEDVANWCGVEFADTASNPLTYSHKIYKNDIMQLRLEVPIGVSLIKKFAFYSCNTLKRVVLPYTIGAIEDNAFGQCTNLRRVIVRANEPPMANYDAFAGVDRNTCYLVVPKGCRDKYRGWCGFNNIDDNENTRHFSFRFFIDGIQYGVDEDDPSHAEVIYGTDDYPADGCMSYGSTINNAIVADSVDLYGSRYAVEQIAERAFYGSKITTIDMPAGIAYIGQEAFSGTGATLKSVTCRGATPPACADGFDSETYQKAVLYVPAGCADRYRSAEPWSNFGNIMESELAGIGDVSADGDGVAVRVEDGRIVIDGVPEGAVVEVYDVAGRQVHRGTGDIPRLTHGVYMVRVGTRVAKVRV